MRWYAPGVLTEAQGAELAAEVRYREFGEPIIRDVVKQVQNFAPVNLADPSYARVEERPAGCPWHHDTGTGKGHMGWCKFTAGILLTDPRGFDGGGFYFRDKGPIHHYLDLSVWDDAPENEHCVTSNSGGRITLLMFFQGGEVGPTENNDTVSSKAIAG